VENSSSIRRILYLNIQKIEQKVRDAGDVTRAQFLQVYNYTSFLYCFGNGEIHYCLLNLHILIIASYAAGYVRVYQSTNNIPRYKMF